MKKSILIITGFCFMAHLALAQEILSFKDWKNNKIQEVQGQITRLEEAQKSSPIKFGPDGQSQLKQAKTNLEIANDLNAQDYFILYLSERFQNDQHAYAKAVQMMSPSDVAQILIGYDKLIEERKKKSLVPVESMKFGFSAPQRLNPFATVVTNSK